MTKKQVQRPATRTYFDRVPVTIKEFGPSMTEQTHARACDINSILARYKKTGLIEHMAKYEPQYGDISECDFKKSMDVVAAVKSEYHELPAYVRAELGSPEAYLEAVSTDEGLEALRALKAPGSDYTSSGAPGAIEDAPAASQEAESSDEAVKD